VVDAPNVHGARGLGLVESEPTVASLRSAVEQGAIEVLYVLDSGPDGSLGDTSWVVEARQAGRLRALIYQGVQSTDLAKIADVVLPGAAWVEKDATYSNDQGRLQAASRVMNPPGEAVDDWQILTSVGASFGLSFAYKSSQEVRAALAAATVGVAGLEGVDGQVFNRPLALKHWLQASNPMERWKWNTMFQDLPPVKGHNVQMETAPGPAVIPLKLVTDEISRASE
jgi:NADH dehydrogenase/NADH:ubiquinone oxidoreductase subunit G